MDSNLKHTSPLCKQPDACRVETLQKLGPVHTNMNSASHTHHINIAGPGKSFSLTETEALQMCILHCITAYKDTPYLQQQ